MSPLADTLSAATAAPELAPSLAVAALRMLAAMVLLGLAAWALIRWRGRSGGTGGQRLKVLDRAFLSRGASVALVRVEGERLLVGVGADGVRLLRDLGPAVSTEPRDFRTALGVATATRKAGS